MVMNKVISLNNISKSEEFNSKPNINQIESKYFDQKVLLYSLSSENIELNENIFSLINFV